MGFSECIMKSIILAGGVGTRLWPLSREYYPKQFIQLDGHSLFQQTYLRATRLSGPGEIYVVTNEIHQYLVRNQIEELGHTIADDRILAEPAGKNTLPAIAWALQRIRAESPSATAVVFPSDHLLGESAHLVQKQRGAAVRGVDELAFAVAVTLDEDRQRPVLPVDAPDLGGDEVRGLVPGDARVLALSAVLGIPLAVRVPVHPLEGVHDPVRRIGPLLVREAPGGGRRLHERLERLAVLLHLPRVEARGIVLGVEVERPDSDDLAVLDIHGARHRPIDASAQAERFENGPL
jgi:hypothetical protein